jgi:hypothetical protein
MISDGLHISIDAPLSNTAGVAKTKAVDGARKHACSIGDAIPDEIEPA